MIIKNTETKDELSIQLIRHATIIITINRLRILVDPMLSSKDAFDPVPNCGNDSRIPMVDLPFDAAKMTEMIAGIDALFITHLHRDHWDQAAQKMIKKDTIIFCQPVDAETIRAQGFTDVRPVSNGIEWQGIQIHRTGGQHGTGEIGAKMGAVSGFLLVDDQESIYIAGDTVWCAEVEKAIRQFQPKTIVLNTGGAKFLSGGPITMTPDDVIEVCKASPGSKIVAVHMDTINHCFVKRIELSKTLRERNVSSNVLIPDDGEILVI